MAAFYPSRGYACPLEFGRDRFFGTSRPHLARIMGGCRPGTSLTELPTEIPDRSLGLPREIPDTRGMPWNQTDPMKERVSFILEWERRWKAGKGRLNLAELSRQFGVSRETAYVWVRRYQASGWDIRAMEDRSRRPLNSPHAVCQEIQDIVVAARKKYPRWGPRKLRALLAEANPEVAFPSAATMSEILRKRGMSRPRRKRRRPKVVPSTQPFGQCVSPNDLWCIDFKGKFRLRNGQWCHVLTIVDAYCRFLVRAEAMLEPTGRAVESVLDSAFLEYGLPRAIRSDNGPPFASTAAGGLTRLSVWWLKLGIRLERIAPGKPQQNGRQERLHLTLEEAIQPPEKTLEAQQARIDLWRREYNETRPHEALKQKAPATLFHCSTRRYPRPLHKPHINSMNAFSRVERDGTIRWRKKIFFITTALHTEYVELEPTDHDSKWEVRYGPLLLGTIDEERSDRGLSRFNSTRLSGISLG